MKTLHVQLFGDFHLTWGDEPVTSIDSSRLQSLLAYLLLHRTAPQSRQQIAFLLWPDSPESQARTNLRKLLFQLRAALPDADHFLSLETQTLQWKTDAPSILDVAEFEKMAMRADSATALREAVNLYRGDLLPGCYDDWMVSERERLRQMLVEAVERLIRLLEDERDYRSAINYAQHLLRYDRLREETYRLLMRLHALNSDRAGVMRVYQTCAAVLKRELDADVSPATQEMYTQLVKLATPSPRSPTGTVTFLFTDIEGSTQLWEKHREAMQAALARHDALLRQAVEAHNGYVFKTIGDAFCAAFPTAPDALAAAIDAQRVLYAEFVGRDVVNASPVQIRVRMALHTGVTEERGDDYVGPILNRAARLLNAGHGGQVLLSQAAFDLVRDSLPHGVSLLDLGERRLRDLVRPEHIYQLVAPELPSEFPPLKTLDTFPNNLPIPLTSFIGRAHEREDIKQMLTLDPAHGGTSRLITLTGAGGCGKTRLAIQVGSELVHAFADGVWFVDLAPLSDGALIPQAIASVLDVREQLGRPLLDTLADSLREKALLLIFDNCEHLLPVSAQIAGGLLRLCPRLRILATSRERLTIAGEAVWRVPSLSLPDPQQSADMEALAQSEAIRLFAERATSVSPTFMLNAQNAASVAQICRRLDGIPLAIELAAARAMMLTPQQIASRLEDSFSLLTQASQGAAPRQQTMRATMDWSHALLSAQEQILFRRLAVFAGGFTLEAVEAVCSDDERSGTDNVRPSLVGIRRDEVLDLLTRLVDKSLVTFVDLGEGEQMRYRLLEPIRQYAQEKLLQSGEAAKIAERHLGFFLKLAQQAGAQLESAEQGMWLRVLESDHENLNVALGWALDHDAIESGVQMVDALLMFWIIRGHLREGREWFARFLALADPVDSAKRATMLNKAALLARYQSDYDTARRLSSEALAIQRELGNRHGIADCLANLGFVALHRGEYDAARSLYEESLVMNRELSNEQGIGDTLSHLALIAYYQGDYGVARALNEQCLAIMRKIGDRQGEAWTLHRLGNVIFAQGEYDTARLMFGENLTISSELDYQWSIAWALEDFARVAFQAGKLERAVRLSAAAAQLRERNSMPQPPPERAELSAKLDIARKALGADGFASQWALGREMALKDAIEYAFKSEGK